MIEKEIKNKETKIKYYLELIEEYETLIKKFIDNNEIIKRKLLMELEDREDYYLELIEEYEKIVTEGVRSLIMPEDKLTEN